MAVNLSPRSGEIAGCRYTGWSNPLRVVRVVHNGWRTSVMVWLISECHPLIGKYELDCRARVEILFVLFARPINPLDAPRFFNLASPFLSFLAALLLLSLSFFSSFFIFLNDTQPHSVETALLL